LAESPDDTSDAALRARLDKLSTTLNAREAPQTKVPAPTSGQSGVGGAMGAGFRVVTELVAGVLVGGGVGWMLDRLLHTKPLMMILLGCLGIAAGFWNIIREAMKPPGGGRSS
jgi:ATP synthase protein I